MSDVAIRAEGLSKRYRIGGRRRSTTLREAVAAATVGRMRDLLGRATGDDERSVWALDDVSLELGYGDVLGVIGRNGAGKSTLLKLLSRITEPTRGYADVNGRVGSLLEVGTGFHSELTGRENVLLSGAILGMRRAETLRKFDEIVAFAGVEKFVDTPVKHYSSGMYLRLAFAVAAHLEPEILLVDEVLAVGDAAFQRRCLGKMHEVGRDGRAVIFVSHDLTAVSRLAPRSIVLDRGRVTFDGPTEEAIRRYNASDSTAGQDLRERVDRQGDGAIRIDAIAFAGAAGEAVEAVGSGDPVDVVLEYSSHLASISPDEIMLDMRFTDVMGHPIATLSTRFSTVEEVEPMRGSGTLVCHVPALPLAEEVYGVDLWLAYRGALADQVLRAAELRVTPAPFFETGEAPVKRKHGAALVRHRWTAHRTSPLAAGALEGRR